MPGSQKRLPPLSHATRLVASAILVVTTVFAVGAVDMIRDGLSGDVTLDMVAAGMMWGYGQGEVAGGYVLAGGTVLALCALTAMCAIGMLRRRGWAREGAMLIIAGYAIILFPGSIASLWHLDAAPNAPWGVAIAVVEVIILIGLLSRPVSDDFADDWQR